MYTTFTFNASLLSTIFLLISTTVFGTCIVIHRTAKGITIGADSKRVTYIGDGTNNAIREVTTNDYCKIRSTGQFTYVVAGAYDDVLHDLANRACLNRAKPIDAMSEFIKSLQSEYVPKLEYFRQYSVAKYAERFPNKETSAGEVAFIYYESGVPHIVCIIINLTNTYSQKVAISIEPFIDGQITLMGAYNNIKKNDGKVVLQRLEKNSALTIKQLIEGQSAATPKFVGGPIDILFIGPKGKQWIAKKKNC